MTILSEIVIDSNSNAKAQVDTSTTIRKSRGEMNSTSLVLYSDDEQDEEDYDTAIGMKPRLQPRRSKICIDDDDDDDDFSDDDFSDDDENYLSPLEQEYDDEKEIDSFEKNKENKNANEKRKDHPDSIIKPKKNKNGRISLSRNNNNPKGTKKTPNPKPRKRRRSSARFLRLSGRFEDDDEGDDLLLGNGGTCGDGLIGGETAEEQQEKLGQMYRQAIRLNAENKINVGNSWGLNLIDNIDKFLGDDDDNDNDGSGTTTTTNVADTQMVRGNGDDKAQNVGEKGLKRVNFTRASCTLDASVKIYSYRVDDVHLSSYKVLANLNRTDGGKEKKKDLFDDGGEDLHGDEEQLNRSRSVIDESRRVGKRTCADTLESNPSNINVSKLDAAYDIDPIFHKMSQKFDEGGAKGLLLVNLGVASDGCRIVLDSKEDSVTDNNRNESCTDIDNNDDINQSSEDLDTDNNPNVDSINIEGEIDISELSNKLQELLLCSPLESIQLVPQLEELRVSYAALEEEGFTDTSKVQKLKSKRYANDEEEEKAAEKIIQREAFERSRASGIQSTSILAPNMSIFTNATSSTPDDDDDDDDDGEQYAPDDFGGGFDDFDDNDQEDPAFDNFIATNDDAKKYSSLSFVESEMKEEEFPLHTSSEKTASSFFLDAVCTGDALNNGGEYNYFDANTLNTIVAGNQWAGSAHWKKSERIGTKSKRLIPKENEPVRKNQKRKKRKDTKDSQSRLFIDLTSSHECLNVLLKDNKKTRGRKSKTDPSQFTQAIQQKHSKEHNILPQDAEISIKQFSTLFMRPDATFSELNKRSNVGRKSVGFIGSNIIPFDDGVDDSYDEGQGFELANMNDDGNFAEMDDYVVKDLEDVRKVDKVRVKHATVAKKVDVKRLKNDLWVELESKTSRPVPVEVDVDANVDADVEGEGKHENENEASMKDDTTNRDVSFKDVVGDLGANETQEDVSLAFYFICVLHLANEKCLKLENGEHGLNDFVISRDDD